LIFDISAIVYINSIYLLINLLPFRFRFNKSLRSFLMIVFLLTNGIAFIANLADVAYYEFVLQRTTVDVFSQFKHEENMGSLLAGFIFEYWYLSLIWIIFMFTIIYLYRRFRVEGPKIRSGIVHTLSGLPVFAGCLILCIVGARGSFKSFVQPVSMSNVWSYVKNPDDAALVLNTPFTLIHSAGKKGFRRAEYFKSDTELEKIYDPLHRPSGNQVRKDNVVIIIVESLNREFIGSLNSDLDNGTYKGYTPFLDSLINFSKVFMHSYANGRKSIDVLPSVFCSLPRIGLPFVLNTPYYRNKINSLPGLMKEMGYKSAFFHGAPNGSFGFQSFTNIIGMDEYYGMDEYNNKKDYDGSWGIWDEEFLQFTAATLDTFSTPFMAGIFTLSSHHPFTLPEKHRERFGKRDFPLQNTVRYTDYSLMRFFKTASEKSWFRNTLFIITADHVSKNQRPEFQNEIGYFSVPIIFYHPGRPMKGLDSLVNAQQTDIMPTVLNYLGYNKKYIAVGKDLLGSNDRNFAFNFLNDTYRLILDDHLLIFNGRESTSLYHLDRYCQLSTNIIEAEPGRKDSMELFIKAYIQQYVNRMIDNRLSVERQDN